MKLTRKFGAYNPRRYGKPWISRVVLWDGEEPKVEWGVYIGDDSGGIVSIDAQPGDIVRCDQRDHRAARPVPAPWLIVQEDGALRKVTKLEAYEWYSQHRTSGLPKGEA